MQIDGLQGQLPKQIFAVSYVFFSLSVFFCQRRCSREHHLSWATWDRLAKSCSIHLLLKSESSWRRKGKMTLEYTLNGQSKCLLTTTTTTTMSTLGTMATCVNVDAPSACDKNQSYKQTACQSCTTQQKQQQIHFCTNVHRLLGLFDKWHTLQCSLLAF